MVLMMVLVLMEFSSVYQNSLLQLQRYLLYWPRKEDIVYVRGLVTWPVSKSGNTNTCPSGYTQLLSPHCLKLLKSIVFESKFLFENNDLLANLQFGSTRGRLTPLLLLSLILSVHDMVWARKYDCIICWWRYTSWLSSITTLRTDVFKSFNKYLRKSIYGVLYGMWSQTLTIQSGIVNVSRTLFPLHSVLLWLHGTFVKGLLLSLT